MMMKQRIKIGLAILLILKTCKHDGVHAYPNGAGHCQPGSSLNTLSYNAHGIGGGGDIENFNLELVAVAEDSSNPPIRLEPSKSRVLARKVRYRLTLKTLSTGDVGFKGFLFRLSGRDGEDASAALSIASSAKEDTIKLDFCSEKVSGISHTNNGIKTSIPIYFYFEEVGNLLLEVTVVQENNPYPMDDWGYSLYKLDIQPGREETVEPTLSFMPSNIPSLSTFPSISPQPSVSSMPSIGPSEGLPFYAWILIGVGGMVLLALRMPFTRLFCCIFRYTFGCVIRACCSCGSTEPERDLFDQEERGLNRELSSVCYDDIVLTTIEVENNPMVGKPNRVTFSESSTKSSSTAVFIRKLNKIEEHVLRGKKWNTYEAEKLSPEQAQILINEESENEAEKSFDTNFNRKVLFTIHSFSTKPHSHLARCQLYCDKFQKFKLIPIIWPCRSLTESIEEKDSGPEACLNLRNIERATGSISKSIMVHGIENRLLRKFAHSSMQFEHIFMVAPDVDKDIFLRKYTEANRYEEWRRDGLRIKDSLLSQEGGKIHILYNKKDSHLNAFLQPRLGRCGVEGEMPQRIKNHIVNIDTERYRKSHPHYYQWDDDIIAFYERKYSRQRVSFTATTSV